ncbi:MAG: gliding motility-associated C-terminal domain-containing protein [Bacteroidota bacterium]
MVKWGLYIIFLFYNLSSLLAQNLVPNPSFEEIDTCFYEDTILPNYWSSPNRGTPNYFNTCSVIPVYQVPNALLCENLWPYTGDCYAGMYVYANVQWEITEYVQAPLLEKLEKDQYYWISFQTAPSEDCPPHWGFTDAMGLAFTSEHLIYDDGVLSDNSSFYDLWIAIENRGAVIDEVGQWTEINGCYRANGAETHVIVGSFANNQETVLVSSDPNSFLFDYMFVDEIVVIPFDPLPDTVLWCEGELYLQGRFLEQPLTWHTGEVADSFLVDQGGLHTVAFEGENGCVMRDTTWVFDLRNIEQFSFEDTICSDFKWSISPGIPGQYQWSTGAQGTSILIDQPGAYEVTVTNECDIYYYDYQIDIRDCACRVFMPNVFSPNGDGLNDFLRPFISCSLNYQFKQLRIYDRWGGLLFEGQTEEEAWDGWSDGRRLAEGVYLWTLEYEVEGFEGSQSKVLSGDVTLIR